MTEIKKTENTELVEAPNTSLVPQDDMEEEKPLVTNEKLGGMFESVLDNIQNDREEISEILANFLDMVMNDGDASSASKEAVVNLIKAKADATDKQIKIADLMTRIKLKEKDTFPRHLAAHYNQTNYNLGKGEQKRLDDQKNILLDEIDKVVKQRK